VIKTVKNARVMAEAGGDWLELDGITAVDVSSEDPDCPIENALRGTSRGWRASTPGVQRLALRFPAPTSIRRIRVVFEERARARTQEFTLDAHARSSGSVQNVVRQQFTFAPPGTSVETEDYATDLRDVERLELTIVPDIGDGTALATLKEWRVAAAGDIRVSSSQQPGSGDPVVSDPSRLVIAATEDPPRVPSPTMVDADAEARWQAWRAKGAAHDRAVEKALLKTVLILGVVGAIALAFVL
jgi:hypothetical protein